MKGRWRRFTAMLLACLMLFGLLFPDNAFAAENSGTELEAAVQAEGADNLDTAADGSLTESDIENISAAAAYIREQMTQRETVITGSLEISGMENMNSVFEALADQIFIYTSESDEGDYLKQHSGGMAWNYEASFDGNVTTFSYELQISYYTTLEQEQEVADRIDEVLADLSLDGLSDYEKAKEIYNYIAVNVSYDYEHLGDSSYMLSHTAYAALIQKTAVCQGYASLFYRMAHEAGLSVRIVTGLVDGEAHAWNMVKIGDLYYYVDATHASSSGNRDDYFLKGSISFADRQLDSDYLSADFTSEFPMSDFDYSDDSGNTEVGSGELTSSIQWCVKSSTDEEGKTTYYLELQGNGEIPDYAQNDELPWEEWRDEITVVTVGSGITKIGSYVFADMDALTTVQIANTVTALGDGAFYNCGKLTNLQIPDSVTSFGNFVIGGTYGKTQWEYNPVEKKLTVTGDGAMGEPYVEGSTTEKNASCVPWNRYRDQIEEVVIEEGVVNLSTYALHGMTSLTAVTLPSTLEEIGEGSFESCTALTYICIPDSVKTIGHYAFRYCEGLRSIHIPASVTTIGVRAFSDCPYLHEFYFYGDAPEFNDQAIMDSEYITIYYDGSGWSDVKALFDYLTFETWEPGEYDDSGTNVSGEGIKSQTSGKYGEDIEWNYDEASAVLTLSGKGEMQEPVTIMTQDETTGAVTISYSTNAVPWDPFSTQIKAVEISDGITSITRFAFYWLSQLESITIPDSVTTIGKQSFVHCVKLQSLTFGDDLMSIGEEAFKDCSALKEIYLSDNLANVDKSAFSGCEALTDVYYEGSENEWEEIVIGEDNDPLINAKIHYNYGEEEPWVPDGAFSISKSGAWVSGKECALYGSYSASTPGNAETEAEKIVWSSSDPSILDVSDTIIDFNVADVDNNHVSIQKSFTAKKAGTVTITATAPDGRSESITVDVEPELVAVGTDNTITKETEITVFKATLEEPNAEYLEKVISQVEVTIADDDSGNAQIKDYYYKIAEDGLSAEIIILLEPLQEDIIEINGVSAGGQEITARINTVDKELSFAPYPNTCMQEARFTITAYYYTPTKPENIKWVCSDEDAVEFSDTTVQILDTADEYNWYKISADVTTKKVGDYSLTLALDDKSLTEPLTIKEGTGFSAYKDGWCIINTHNSFGFDEDYHTPLDYFVTTYQITINSLLREMVTPFLGWGGDCFGLSLLAVAEYNGQINLSNYFNNKGNGLNEYGFTTQEYWSEPQEYWDEIYDGKDYSGNVYTLKGNSDIIEIIERAQISQCSNEIKNVEVLKNDRYYEELLTYLKQDDAAPLLVSIGGTIQHTMAIDTSLKPFEVEEGVFRVYLYNPNCPKLTNKLDNPSIKYLLDQSYIDFNTNTDKFIFSNGTSLIEESHSILKFHDISKVDDTLLHGICSFDMNSIINMVQASELTIASKNDETKEIFSLSNGKYEIYDDSVEYTPYCENNDLSNDSSSQKGTIWLPYGAYEFDSESETSVISIQNDFIYGYNTNGEAKIIIDNGNITVANEGSDKMDFAIAIQDRDGSAAAIAEGILDASTNIYLKMIPDGESYAIESETNSNIDNIETHFEVDGEEVLNNFHVQEHSYIYADNGDGTHTKSCISCDASEIEPHTYEDGICQYCQAEEPEEHSHAYGEPKFEWSKDNETCTAVFNCESCNDEQKMECDITREITDPTCTGDGKTVYTATVAFEGKEYSDTQEKVIPATGHTYEYTDNGDGTHTKICTAGDDTVIERHIYQDGICTSCGAAEPEEHEHVYGEPEFTWSEDYQTCTAIFTCKNGDDEQKVECKVTSETMDPTCTEAGKTVYTATVDFEGKEYTDTQEETISATGHTYEYTDNGDGTHTKVCIAGDETATEPHTYQDGICTFCGAEEPKEHVHEYGIPEFKWSEDYQTCVAVFTCKDGDDQQNIECEVTDEITDATCTENGKAVYTAKGTFDGKEYTDVKEVEIPASGHAYGTPEFNWSDDYTTCTAVFICESCNDEQKIECDITSETTDPTCTGDGKTVYTATVSFTDKEYTDTQEEVITATGHTYEYTDNGDGTHTKVCTAGDDTAAEPHTYQDGTCTYCGAEEPKEHIHEYGTPEFNWSEDYTTCTAVFTCKDGDDQQSIKCEVTDEVTDATCTENGKASYTAKVTFGDKEYTDVKEQEIPASGHTYGTPEFNWSEDYQTCTAVITCESCDDQQKMECDIVSETTDPTCTEDGKTTYTATVAFEGKEYSDTQEEVIPAAGHTYEYIDNGDGTHTKVCTAGDDTTTEPHIYQDGICISCGAEEPEEHEHVYGEPEFIWSEDNQTCTAIFTCKNGDDEQKVECKVASETTDPTCTEAGKTVYTATALFGDQEYTDTKEEEIPAAGHSYEYTDNGDGTHTKVCTIGDDTAAEPHTYQDGICVYCGAEEPEGHVHEYGEPEFIWSEDCKNCTIVFTCADGDDQQKIECEVTSEITDATCTENGKAVYTAKGSFNGEEYSDMKEEEIPASGHAYGEPVFSWSEDYQTCTAVFTCESGDDEQSLECEVVSETTEPTCTASGKTVYTATVLFNDKEYLNTQEETIVAAGHTYEYRDNGDGTHTKTCTVGDDSKTEPHTYQDGICAYCGAEEPKEHVHEYGEPEFSWADDFRSCTAAFTCTDNDDQQTVECTVESKDNGDGTVTYTAVAEFNETSYTDTQTVKIPEKSEGTDNIETPTGTGEENKTNKPTAGTANASSNKTNNKTAIKATADDKVVSSAKTGDDTNVALWILLLAAAGATGVMIVRSKKKMK